jgi:hypothetical protein
MIIVTLDTICELLKDYLGPEYVPSDARATRLLINPQEEGRLALEIMSPDIKPNDKPLFAHFDIKRNYTVG